ncbi:MAG TPA: hypothetical protein VGA08_04175 [Candidatus Saccharimonadales bacterium]
MDDIDLLITLAGTGLVLISLLIELEHKVIWKRYRQHYHPHQNRFVDSLLRPNKWVYSFQVYILWPAILVLGLFILLRNAN